MAALPEQALANCRRWPERRSRPQLHLCGRYLSWGNHRRKDTGLKILSHAHATGAPVGAASAATHIRDLEKIEVRQIRSGIPASSPGENAGNRYALSLTLADVISHDGVERAGHTMRSLPTTQQTRHAEVFIEFRPVNALTLTEKFVSLQLFSCGRRQTWKPDQRDNDFSTIHQRHDQIVICKRNALRQGMRLNCQCAHSTPPGTAFCAPRHIFLSCAIHATQTAESLPVSPG